MKLAGTVAVLGLALTACGGSSEDPKETAAAAPADKAAQYSKCMRDNGVPSFPDPVNGRLQLQIRKGSDLDPESPAWKTAEAACKHLQPEGAAGAGQDPKAQEQMLKFVKCMRESGVPKFPDSEPGRMKITPEMGVDPNSPEFQAAMTKCRPLMPGGANTGGQ